MSPTIGSALTQSGVADAVLALETLQIHEIETISVASLRAIPGTVPESEAAAGLPTQTGQCADGSPAVLCLRPNEWLLVDATATPADLLDGARRQYAERGFLLWDQSDGLGVIRVAGRAAPWLIRKYCGLELPFWGVNATRCAQTRFGHICVLMHYGIDTNAGRAFDLYIDRSLARYAWELLTAGAPHACALAKRVDTTDRAQS